MDDRTTVRNLLVRLQEPWWTPLHPSDYVMTAADGRPAGVGLIVEQDFDAWNLSLALSRSMKPPRTLDDHRNLLCNFMHAKTQLAPVDVLGQPLGSYATLMRPSDFERWLRDLPRRSLDVQVRRQLIHGLVAMQSEGAAKTVG